MVLKKEGGVKMIKNFFTATIFLVLLAACAYQAPPTIMDSQNPRIIIKEIPASSAAEKGKEKLFETSYVYPDLTKGRIENQAFPFVPKVFLIKRGQKVVLIGPEIGPPEFNTKEIREFNLPPGRHILHIERWQHFSAYGGWKKVPKTEVVKVSVAQFDESGGWNRWRNNHYGWSIIVYDDHSIVRSGYR